MRVLMLGWEFPPYISGGLGTACRGLTDAMRRLQTRILFVLPRTVEADEPRDSLESDDSPDSLLNTSSESRQTAADLELAAAACEVTSPYQTTLNTSPRKSTQPNRPAGKNLMRRNASSVRVMGVGAEDGYDGDLVRKIHDYSDRCVGLTRRELFDVIHAHDWMTFPAGMAIAEFSGRPLVVHVHATEFDRSGENINRPIYDIERQGMQAASRVIAVSHRTKQIIVRRYGVPASKVDVVHNGIDFDRFLDFRSHDMRGDKIVLFLGRITMQKGPEFFVRAAARVAERVERVKFVIAGAGDQLPYIVGLVNELGLQDLVEFKGFLRGSDVDQAYRSADVYVMPSVSEPFGLTALEAARHGVPVVLSSNSGVAEVLKRGSLKVDFWDVEMMAKMIVSVLEYPRLAEALRRESAREINGLTWEDAAQKCIGSYYDTVSQSQAKTSISMAAV